MGTSICGQFICLSSRILPSNIAKNEKWTIIDDNLSIKVVKVKMEDDNPFKTSFLINKYLKYIQINKIAWMINFIINQFSYEKSY